MSGDRPSVDPRALGRLRWRCRRGLLENDLLIQRFFEREGDSLSPADVRAMERLMDLPDNDLLDLFLRRTEPDERLGTPEVRNLLERIRVPQ